MPDTGRKPRIDPRLRKALVALARTALAVAVVYYVWRSLSASLTSSGFLGLEFSGWHLAAAWAVLLVYYAWFIGGLDLVIRALGYRPSYRDVFKLSFAANLGKYLPGGFWQVAGKVAMAKSAGVDSHAALVATVVETFVSVAGALLCFTVTLLFGAPAPAWVPVWAVGLLAVGLIASLHPALFGRVIGLGMRLLKIDGEVPHLRFGAIARLTAYYFASWFIAGLAFWLFTRSLTPDPGVGPLAYAGYYAAAMAGGLLVLFVPAGLGVREGILLTLLQGAIAGPGAAGAAAVVSVAARVWSTLAELVLSGVAVMVPFSHRGEQDTDAGPDVDGHGDAADGEAS